ncbi:MAG: Gfo/Idh/MocA family oxidoreductase [Phycisphaeraceae bacterium]|nr:MAG: Gfo/Idh/MocA family oxidoreductase [Phycisphaeraceae bacterium]
MAFITHIPGCNPVIPPPKATDALGLAVVGLHEGRTLLLASNRCAHLRPVAACDLSAEKIAASRAELPELFYSSDFEEVLARPEVDVVGIYTPDHVHARQITRAFEAGKHVICTKPLVITVEDARAVLAAGRRTGKRLMVGQSSRFFEPFRRQRARFEKGLLGDIELADAHYIHRMDWYYDKSPWVATDTDWVFLGLSHPIDLLAWYLGPIRRVHAMASRSALARRYKTASPDIYTLQVECDSGAVGRAMGHYGVHELPTARNCIELMLYGSGGSSLAQYHDMKHVYTDADNTEVTEDHLYAGRHYYFNSEVHGMHYGEFANYAEYFARSILENTPNSPDLEEGISTFCVMEAVRRASREKRPVDVDPIRAEVGL